jgi:hypothetical protein
MNNTSMQVWVKNYNASNVIDMQVLPSYRNLFNATGYLGHAPVFNQTRIDDNGYLVFSGNPDAYYNNFHNYSGFSTFAGSRYMVDNGITEYGYNSTAAQSHSGIQLNVSLNGTAFTAYANTEWNTFNGTTIVFQETSLAVGLVNSGSGYASQWYPYGNGNTITTDNSLYTQFQTEWFNFSYSNGIGHVKAGIIGYPTSYFNASESLTWGQTSIYLRDNYYINYVFLTPKMAMPTFTIGAFTNMTDHAVASYLSNSITIPMPNWFNLTLKAYTNYSFTFHYNNTPLYFTYDGLINNTIYTGFLDSNLTLNIHFIALGYSGKTELIVGR